jgi:hypothetical protein
MTSRRLLICLLLALASFQAVAQEAERKAATGADGKPVELPGSSVIGNRELPVGLDIVPWRPAATGQVKEGPTQLLDAPLKPIDPEVFRRELSIYQSSQP